MRKLVLAVMTVLVCFSLAQADTLKLGNVLEKIPAVNNSVLYSLDKGEVDYASTITLVELFNKRISIDAGYTPSQEAIASVTFKLIEVGNYIQFPILKWATIEPGAYVGVDRISLGAGNAKDGNELDYGIIVKLLRVAF